MPRGRPKKQKTEKAEQAKPPNIKAEGKEVGRITHFFDKINVAVVEMTGKMKIGDKIGIKGNTTDFEMSVGSMQIEHEKISEAKKGQAIGMKVSQAVREHDRVYVL